MPTFARRSTWQAARLTVGTLNVATYILFCCRAEIAAGYLLLYTSANFRLFEFLLFFVFVFVFAILQPLVFDVLFI